MLRNRPLSAVRSCFAILWTSVLMVLLVGCGGSTPSSSPSPNPTPGSPGTVQQRSLTFQSTTYQFFVYVPTAYDGVRSLPALLLAHGFGSNGQDFLNLWKDFAEKNGIILVSPTLPYTLTNPPLGNLPPTLFPALMNQAQTEWKMDKKRIYIFGYSAGGVVTFEAIMPDSTYFAAAGIFASIIAPGDEGLLPQATRKIPVALYIGDSDQFFTLDQVRATRDLLLQNNFPVHYVELSNQDHSFTTAAPNIEGDAWTYLSQFSAP